MRNTFQISKALIRSAVLLGAVLWSVSGTSAFAQFGANRISYPFGRPTVSPYLNLLGNNSGAGVNYYALVRPQQQFYQQAEDLRQGRYTRPETFQRNMIPRQTGHSAYRLGTTGHSASFQADMTEPLMPQNLEVVPRERSEVGIDGGDLSTSLLKV